jgi:chromosome segregation ATPase
MNPQGESVMAKTLNNKNEGKKKQEKRKEKLLLKIEEARKEVKKAEQKFAKAQTNLEASRDRLRELEEGLAQIEAEPSVMAVPGKQSYEHPEEIKVPDQGESYEDREVVEELHQSSLPPVEGRADIAQ